MTNVETLRKPDAPSEKPTEASASRDAIGALLDRICADVMHEVEAAERGLQQLGDEMLQNTARVKAQLADTVSVGGTLRQEVKRFSEVVAELRAEQARLVEGKG